MNSYHIHTLCIAGLLTPVMMAGTVVNESISQEPRATGFEGARRPITNPTLFDLAIPKTQLHPIFVHHRLPDQINTVLGDLPLGGDVQVYALQFEWAVSPKWSIVATKDGYIDVDPDSTLSSESGFANLGAGLKYAFLYDPQAGSALSGTVTFELPTGNSNVFQGEGDGSVNLILSGLKMMDAWQFAGATGLILPFSDVQTTSGWVSAHASYEVTPWFIPLVEVNWFHVIDAGDGSGNFPKQAAGGVPAIAEFEGGDFFNLGAVNSENNQDFVTAAVGFRSRINEQVNVGLAYELPLTDEENSVMEDRVTLDLVWEF